MDCGADVVACLVGLDPDAIEAALLAQDAVQLIALGLWPCTRCGRRDAPDPQQMSPHAWCVRAGADIARQVEATARAHAARARFRARNLRLEREAEEQTRERFAGSAANASKTAVEAALARARLAKADRTPPGA